MTPSLADLLERRIATQHFDPARPVSPAQLQAVVRLASLAPSAYNLQNWRLVAVQTPQAKARLQAAAYGQPKIAQAPLTLVVVGDTEGYRKLAERLQPSVAQDRLPAGVAAAWVEMASATHQADPMLRRDEAVRSAALAAMTLLLAAESLGLATGPMSGFDPAAVAQALALAPGEIPVMLVSLGHAAAGNGPQKARRAVEEILSVA